MNVQGTMSVSLLVSLSLFTLGGGLGCSGGKADNANINETLVKQQTERTLNAAKALQERGEGQLAALSLVATAMSAPALLESKATQEQTQAANAAIQDFDPQRFAAYAVSGQCNCTGSECNFQACSNGAGVEVTGNFAWTRERMACDYDARVQALGVTFNLEVDCDLSFENEQVNGTLTSSGSLEGQSGGQLERASWSSFVNYSKVSYDRNRHQLTGVIDLEANYEDTRGEDLRGSAKLDFGE